MQTNTIKPAARSINRVAAPKVRRPLSDAQRAVLPLRPIFDACKRRGLTITPDNKAVRLYQVNKFLCQMPEGFDWIETSFKELLSNTCAIIVIADAIERGAISWI